MDSDFINDGNFSFAIHIFFFRLKSKVEKYIKKEVFINEIAIVCEFYVYISLDIIDVKVQSDLQMKGQVINKLIVIVQWSYHLSRVITAKKIGTHTFLMYARLNAFLLKLVYVLFQFIQS